MASSSWDDLHPGYGPPVSTIKTSTIPYPYQELPANNSEGFEAVNTSTNNNMAQVEGFQVASGAQAGGDVARTNSTRQEQPSSHSMPPQSPPPADHATPQTPPALLRQASAFSFSSWRQPAIFQPQLQHDQKMEDNLTFYQRHFTKPVITSDSEKRSTTSERQFAYLSHGSIIAATMLLFLLLGIVGAAVGVTLTRGDKCTYDPEAPNAPTYPHGGLSPIRQALDDNFPDPTIWYNNGTWYAYATNNAAGILHRPENASSYEYGVSNVQVATSPDFVNWTLLNSQHDPLPKTGMWVAQGVRNFTGPKSRVSRGNIWAPSVIQRKGDSKYLLYYTGTRNRLESPGAEDAASLPGASEAHALPAHPVPHCIGASVSKTDSPMGPFDPMNITFACPIEQGGAIDPAAFYDTDDTLYVSYKIDGNNIGHGGSCGNMKHPIVPTPIMLQQMHPSGLLAVGDPVEILNREESDGPLIEAPELIRSPDGIYFLFFSSGCTRANSYNVKYATAMDIKGPYERADAPLLKTGMWGLKAPGSVGIHADGSGGWNMAFHARVPAAQGGIRAFFTTKLQLDGRTAKLVRDEPALKK